MFCMNCGMENSDENKFCRECGTPFLKVETQNDSFSNAQKPLERAEGANEPQNTAQESPDEPSTAGTAFCPKCGKEIRAGLNYCNWCGSPLTALAIALRSAGPTHEQLARERELFALQQQQLALTMQAQQLKLQQDANDVQFAEMSSQMHCPKCGSVSLTGHKKGFGVGKSVIGGLLGTAALGPLGLVGLAAGSLGGGKVRITCLSCGHKFWAGKTRIAHLR